MRVSQLFVALTVGALVLSGCKDLKDPAETAVAQGETALNDIRQAAQQYAPEQLQAPEATLARFKAALAQGEYNTVLEGIPQFNAEMKTLRETVTIQQTAIAAATNEWQALSVEVPKAVEEIEKRVKNLNASRLPQDVTRENFEAAKANLEPLKSTWAEATAAHEAGDALAAADKARTAKQRADEMKTQLALNPV